MDAEEQTRVEVLSARSVQKVELVTFESNVATEDNCEDLKTFVEKSVYYFDASARGPGSWSFVLAGYCEDASFCDVGKANVNLLGMLLHTFCLVKGCPLPPLGPWFLN